MEQAKAVQTNVCQINVSVSISKLRISLITEKAVITIVSNKLLEKKLFRKIFI